MQKKIKVAGGQLAVEAKGDGAAVIFLHAGVCDRRMWRSQMSAAADMGFMGIAVDQRGFGQSKSEDVAFSRVQDLVAVFDALQLKRVIFVGCSQGGRQAIDFALAFPNRIDGMLLVATALSGAPPPPELPDELKPFLEQYEAVDEAGDVEALNEFEARVWLDGPFGDEGRVQGSARDLFLEMNGTALAHVELTKEVSPPNAYERLEELNIPVALVSGGLDFPGHELRNQDMAGKIAGAHQIHLEQCAHLPALERPDLFNPILTEFLRAFSL